MPYVLQRDDMNRDFDDAIAVTGHWTKYGVTYAIPFRSPGTDEVANLLVAGRCISVDHRTHHATKRDPAEHGDGRGGGYGSRRWPCGRASPSPSSRSCELRDRLRRAGAIVDRPA